MYSNENLTLSFVEDQESYFEFSYASKSTKPRIYDMQRIQCLRTADTPMIV